MKAYTIAIGNFHFPPTNEQKYILNQIKKLEGFIGIYFAQPKGNLLLFHNKNQALAGKHFLTNIGVEVGTNIGECEYDTEETH